ncbi:MAG: hypothetical protein E3J30_06695 [Anaerolineales bacterium]|nr:MAG: hypothetical protein E3J30_06695 [Anaerolineales bacterium]
MSEVIHVEARFGEDGEILPLVFVWEERRFTVLTLGRQWQEGQSRHFLVMTYGEQVFEIAYSEEDGSWCMGRSPAEFRRKRMAV